MSEHTSPALPSSVKIIEVGPRDGLQNETRALSTEIKTQLIERLVQAGLKNIEATAFVSPKWVPQMADNAAVMAALEKNGEINYPVLVPNLKGLEAAIAAGAKEIAVFGSASEAFSQKNINCSIEQSIQRFTPVIAQALQAGMRVRGYISCVLGCPYGEPIQADTVADIAAQLHDMGCYEISLGDTIGSGNPVRTQQLIAAVTRKVSVAQLAGHFHDTYGMAIANIYAALQMGVAVFDASVAGLGGCPYARGATGNVATEDLVWLLHGLGIETGVDLAQLVECAQWISARLERPPASRVARALAKD